MISQVGSIPPEGWAAAGALLTSIVSGVFVYLGARKANETRREANERMAGIEKEKLSVAKAEQFQRATENLIANLRSEIERLKERIQELTYTLDKERQENAFLRNRMHEDAETTNRLRHKVMVLQKRLGGDEEDG